MSNRMLYSERQAFAAMPSLWRPVHRLLRRAYWPFARFQTARDVWGLYRRTWPR